MSSEINATEAKTLLSQLTTLDLSDPSSQQDAILKCQSLINALQDPGDKAMETFFSFTTFPCLATANGMGIFKKLALSQGPLTASQLAEQTGADALLIARVMRVITAAGVVAETGPESYVATPVTHIYAGSAYEAGLRFANNLASDVFHLPDYLQSINYRNPSNNIRPGPFQYCVGTELSTFEWLAENPVAAHDFNLFMTQHRSQAHWSESFPVQSEIFDGVAINNNSPLVVDVAGGFGHDLRILKSKLPPTSKGQLVLEDQAQVIDTVPDDVRDADIEYVKYNFFTANPVEGARVYTFKSIMHDWPDDKAAEILQNTASAMTPGYSKVWLLDGIVPATNTPIALASMDITMMWCLEALERTEKQWHSLLERVGLVITKLVPRPDGFGVVEAMRKT